jgi:hypothetical protein
MTASTSTAPTTRRRTADRQEAAREHAALVRLQTAVTTMRAWRQLADPPASRPTHTNRTKGARYRDQEPERR